MTDQMFFNVATLVVAVGAVVLSFQAHRYNQRRNDESDYSADIAALNTSLGRLEHGLNSGLERISKLEGLSEVSWRVLEIYAGKTLHRHGDELHIDYYLDNYKSLTAEEVQAFVNRLHQIANDIDIGSWCNESTLCTARIADGTRMAAAVELAAIIRRYGQQYLLELPPDVIP